MTEMDLAKRLERLERDNRRLKRIALVVVALLGATVGLAATYARPAIPEKIAAHEFDVLDGSGKVRIQMGLTVERAPATAGGSSLGANPFIRLAGERGDSMLLDLGGGPGITLSSAQGILSLMGGGAIGGVTGGPEVALGDGHDNAAVTLTIDKGAPAVSLTDQAGMVRAKMNVGEGSSLYLSDKNGKQRVILTEFQGNPYLWLTDAQEHERAEMSVSASGSGTVKLADPQGFEMDLGTTQTIVPTTGQTQQTSAASIVMFGNGKEHKVIWQAP